jgi:hypothetical protein
MRWLVFAPVAFLALFAPSANAEPVQGLQTTYYTIDSVPPTRADHFYTECGSEVENNINRSYDGEPYLDCTNDLFMVHMTGFIDVPEHDTIEFWLASDDGGTIDIGGYEWGYWGDQGCSATESGQIDISAGSQQLDLWMYENGGNTCLMLAWNIDNLGWTIVPDKAFTTFVNNSTTTTSTIYLEQTTLPISTTTTEEIWDTTTTSTIQETNTSTIAPSTTAPATEKSTTSTLQITTTLPPDTTVPEPTTTTTVKSPTLTSAPPISVFPTTLPIEQSTTTSSTLPILLPLPDSLSELVVVLDSLQSMSNVEAVEVVSAILEEGVTANFAIELASSPEVLAVVTSSQAEEIFAAIEVSELDQAAITELVEAVQSAPVEVREAFEETIDVFGAGFDEYVPTGSNVPVSKRRTIVAVMAGVSLTVVNGRAPRRLSSLR